LAEVSIPGSKSITARALFLAACAEGTSRLERPLLSDDTDAFASGLAALGYTVDRPGATWSVTGLPAGPGMSASQVYCRDAGTAARFLPVLSALGEGQFHFDASEQMRRRPMGPVLDALRELGSAVTCEATEGYLPFTIKASGLRGGRISLDAGISSQFLTGLLMAAPLMDRGLTIDVSRIVSAPYVEMTVAMMRQFGASVDVTGSTFSVPAQEYVATEYPIEPDASTSSYFLAAAALTGTSVTVPGLGADSLQGDLRFAQVLQSMGADVRIGATSITVTGTGGLSGIDVNMRDISDTMPTLAAIAPFADGPVRISDVYNTRVKECDRLEACATNLRRMAVPVSTGRDWIEIHPGKPQPAVISCYGDHRIAMSFSVTGLRAPGIVLDDPGCVRKTFPEFHQTLAGLREAWSETDRP
jgi:3-phosphoshikimate 1-carboxyvinyltransferase